MYIPASFAVDKSAEIEKFINNNAFGQLTSVHRGRLFATHMPFIYDTKHKRLLGHFASQNPQHQDLAGQEVMVSFSGPHAYISPTWYASPGVPTWNYQVVHVYGQSQVFNDPKRLKQTVDQLAGIYEANQSNPWQPDYPDRMLKAIVGIEINITDIQAKFKLSQNRSKQDQQQVVEHLKRTGQGILAATMKMD